ncbi:transposase [Salmonella enterica subsp. diarizonae]
MPSGRCHPAIRELHYFTTVKANQTYKLLPPYSPNLNPIERLWKVMNDMVRNNRYFATAKEFREKIRYFFSDTLPELAGNLSCRINDHFLKMKNAFSS